MDGQERLARESDTAILLTWVRVDAWMNGRHVDAAWEIENRRLRMEKAATDDRLGSRWTFGIRLLRHVQRLRFAARAGSLIEDRRSRGPQSVIELHVVGMPPKRMSGTRATSLDEGARIELVVFRLDE